MDCKIISMQIRYTLVFFFLQYFFEVRNVIKMRYDDWKKWRSIIFDSNITYLEWNIIK